MPNRPLVTRPTSLHIHLPEDIRGRIDLHLWSEVEQRVPKGAYQKLIVQLLREYFKSRDESNVQS
jgi:hypothetical protein